MYKKTLLVFSIVAILASCGKIPQNKLSAVTPNGGCSTIYQSKHRISTMVSEQTRLGISFIYRTASGEHGQFSYALASDGRTAGFMTVKSCGYLAAPATLQLRDLPKRCILILPFEDKNCACSNSGCSAVRK